MNKRSFLLQFFRASRVLCVVLLLASATPARALSPQSQIQAVTFTVNDTRDLDDNNLIDPNCDISTDAGAQCTLRAALQQANTNGGSTLIQFSVGTISPASPLPVVSGGEFGSITLRGNQAVTLDGSLITPGTTSIGLNVIGTLNKVQGLTIQDFSIGIQVSGNFNTIGVDDSDGIFALEACTIISNDETDSITGAGISITGNNNIVAGNLVGIMLNDTASGNENGIYITGNSNRIGTDGDGLLDANERNYISSNTADGILIKGAYLAPISSNRVAGNTIGLNIAGDTARGNGQYGIKLHYADSTFIGTNGDGSGDAVEGNLIGANEYGISSSNSNLARIAGNRIGVNAAGTSAIPNLYDGIELYLSDDNTIGTDGDGVSDNLEGNLISGNGKDGIDGLSLERVRISGNLIGLNASGASALPNLQSGIFLDKSLDGLVGTDGNGVSDSLERNIISGNGYNGILLAGRGPSELSSGNILAGNYIGTHKDGDLSIPNQRDGVRFTRYVQDNTLGGSLPAQRNVISGNLWEGVHLEGCDQNTVRNNYLGKSADSNDYPAGNGYNGLLIERSSDTDYANNNLVVGNSIAHNGQNGIRVGKFDGDLSSGNRLENNSLYDNADLGIDLGMAGTNMIDNEDPDTGPNGQQNFPEIVQAAYSGITLNLTMHFNSTPNAGFTLWFYRSPTCDSSNYGEGLAAIGTGTVTLDADGEINGFVIGLNGAIVSHNEYITALAIHDASGNTSEFSYCRQFTGYPPTVFPLFLPAILR